MGASSPLLMGWIIGTVGNFNAGLMEMALELAGVVDACAMLPLIRRYLSPPGFRLPAIAGRRVRLEPPRTEVLSSSRHDHASIRPLHELQRPGRKRRRPGRRDDQRAGDRWMDRPRPAGYGSPYRRAGKTGHRASEIDSDFLSRRRKPAHDATRDRSRRQPFQRRSGGGAVQSAGRHVARRRVRPHRPQGRSHRHHHLQTTMRQACERHALAVR